MTSRRGSRQWALGVGHDANPDCRHRHALRSRVVGSDCYPNWAARLDDACDCGIHRRRRGGCLWRLRRPLGSSGREDLPPAAAHSARLACSGRRPLAPHAPALRGCQRRLPVRRDRTRRRAASRRAHGRVALAIAPDTIRLTTGSSAVCATEHPRALRLTLDHLHWLTSGATSFARGMNGGPVTRGAKYGLGILAAAGLVAAFVFLPVNR